MKIDDLKKKVLSFLDSNVDFKKPLLLGLSGGIDSLALLHLLLEHPRLRLAIAHVDHGYRTESADEALLLKELSDELGLPFHTVRLNTAQFKGNLEDAWRIQRYAFFKKLCTTHGYQAVALGHHADDQIETVLKRTLEGAHLTALSGILASTTIHGVKVLRPLIKISKADLSDYVQMFHFKPFHDSSNDDTRFLRARMRLEIFPLLQGLFGKNIRSSLKKLADESIQLKKFLDDRTDFLFSSIIKGAMGALLDLSGLTIPHRFELSHLIRRFCAEEGQVLSREQIEIVCGLIENGAANRRIDCGAQTLYIDRRRLFLTASSQNLPSPPSAPLLFGKQKFQEWTIRVEKISQNIPIEQRSSWLEAWKGRLAVPLPSGNYVIGIASSTQPYKGLSSEIGKWWSDHKVPAFMRTVVPVILHNNIVIHEFLTGKSASNDSLEEGLMIQLTYRTGEEGLGICLGNFG